MAKVIANWIPESNASPWQAAVTESPPVRCFQVDREILAPSPSSEHPVVEREKLVLSLRPEFHAAGKPDGGVLSQLHQHALRHQAVGGHQRHRFRRAFPASAANSGKPAGGGSTLKTSSEASATLPLQRASARAASSTSLDQSGACMGLQEQIYRYMEHFGQPLRLGFADTAFATEDLGDTALWKDGPEVAWF